MPKCIGKDTTFGKGVGALWRTSWQIDAIFFRKVLYGDGRQELLLGSDSHSGQDGLPRGNKSGKRAARDSCQIGQLAFVHGFYQKLKSLRV